MSELIKKSKYYYLKKQYRKKSKQYTKELYLGKELPDHIKEIKEIFDKANRKERFEELILTIKKRFEKVYTKLPQRAQEIYLEQFAVKFTYNTQAIEGSTLTLKDTKFLIEDGIAPEKPIKLIDETRDHYSLFFEMLEYKKDLSLDLIYLWHKKLFERSYPNIAGKFRSHNVAVSGSKSQFPSHIEVEYLMHEFMKWYKKNKKHYNGVELAALVHLKFVSIHPFSDGNGRMSRLLMNFILYKNDFPLLDIPYGDRRRYYTALENSQVRDDTNFFLEFILKLYIKDYKTNILLQK